MNHPVVFLKAHVGTFTRKDGTIVQAHDTKVQAAGAPAPGDIGHEEHKQYGVYFRPGDKARDREGNTHTVVEHHGPSVRTLGGANFHPTKLEKVHRLPADEVPPKPEGMSTDAYLQVANAAKDGDLPLLKLALAHYENFEAPPAQTTLVRELVEKLGEHQAKAKAAGAQPQATTEKPAAPKAKPKPKPKPAPSDDRVNSDDAFDQIKAAAGGGANVKTSSGGINYAHKTGSATLAHRDEPDGSRTVSKRELDQHLAKLKGGDSKPALDAHPNVIGKATDVSKSGMFMKFGGKSYASTGKSGKSLHDGTPVEEYKHEDSGHRVWKDAQHRVHADSAEEAKKVRGEK
jgi:hypothetical protein